LENSSSRIGVRGTNDLGGGLEGFYQYEMLVGTENGNESDMETRLAHVGLRGDFGSVVAGAFWPDTYNWVYGSTDVANRQSGSLTGGFGQYRTSKSLQYTTPDLNGFQGALLVKADAGSADFDGNGKDDNDVDHWSLAGAYEIAGFSIGASYSNSADAIAGEFPKISEATKEFAVKNALAVANMTTAVGMSVARELDHLSGSHSREDYLNDLVAVVPKKKDLTSWAIKLGYSQDNWYVNSWYGEINHSDSSMILAEGIVDAADTVSGERFRVWGESPSLLDTEVFSIAGGISVDKVSIYAVYENREKSYLDEDSGFVKQGDETRGTLGAQYTLGSNSWTWIEYASRDIDASKSEASDFSIGLGHSF
jgi:predicted porin